LHVGGYASRTTALGGQRYYLNNETAVAATQVTTTTTGMIGGVIGGVPASSNGLTAPAVGAGNWFDLYELAIWNMSLTDSQADAVAAAMVANYAIPPITRRLVLEGDSITDGIATTMPVDPKSSGNMAMILTEPGSELVAPGTAVINFGTSGNQVSNLETRKNAAQSLFAKPLTGGPANNVVAVMIGRNDMALGGMTASQHYTNVVNLLSSAVAGQEGYLQRGYRVVLVANIAGAGTVQPRLLEYRSMVADTANREARPGFLTDCQSGSGQVFAGQLGVLHPYAITLAGDAKFDTQADAQDVASGQYDDDATHLRLAGITLLATGGDTPQHGYGSIL
jgi:hypothetical protein